MTLLIKYFSTCKKPSNMSLDTAAQQQKIPASPSLHQVFFGVFFKNPSALHGATTFILLASE